MSFLQPVRLYADTAILRDLSRNRCEEFSRQAFIDLLDAGEAVLVLSPVHLVEIAKGPQEPSRDPLTLMLAPFVEQRRVLWVRSLGDLCRLEWAQAALLGGDGRLGPEHVFGTSLRLLAGRIPEDEGRNVVEPPFPKQVEVARRALRSSGYVQGAADLALRGLSGSQKRRMSKPKGSRLYSEVERIFRAYSWLPADSQLSAGFRPDLSRMPACRVRVAYEEGSDLAGIPVKANDAEDWFHLAGAAYCDIAFADKRTFDRLSKARYLPASLRLNRYASDILGAL